MSLNNPFNFLNKYFGWNSDLFTNTGQQADSPVYEDEQQDNSVGPVQTDAYAQQSDQSYAQPAQQQEQQEQTYQVPSLTQQTQDILPTVYAPALGLGTDPMNSVGMDAKWQIDPNNLASKIRTAEADLEAMGSGQSGDPRLNKLADIPKTVASFLAADEDPMMSGANFDSSNELYDDYYANQGYDKDAQDTENGDIMKQGRQSVAHLLNSGMAETAANQTGDDDYAALANQEREASKGKDGSYWNKLLKGTADMVGAVASSIPIGLANAVDPEQAELGLGMDETETQHENIRNDMEAAGLTADWRNAEDELKESWQQHAAENVDDGTLAYSNLTSNWVTGKQLKAQVDAGLTELDNYDDIDDNQIYSKRELELNHGYTPYLPDEASKQNLVEQNAMGIPSALEATIRNSRENLTSYNATVDDQTVNSKDFDLDKAREWLESQKGSATETYTDQDGNTFRQSDFATDSSGNAVCGTTEDGFPYLALANGSAVVFDNHDNWNDNVEEANAWLSALIDATNGKRSNDVFEYGVEGPQATYTLPSGQELTYDQVARLYNDTVKDEDTEMNYDGHTGVSYDFGPFNIGKPKAAIESEHDKDGDWVGKYFNPFADAVPTLWDLASTSVPYVMDEVAIPMALSDAYMSSVNVDPWSTKADGSMTKAADELSEETKDALRAQGIDPDEFQDYRTGAMSAERALSNATTPWSEKIFSNNPIKEKSEQGLTKLLSRIPVIGKHPITKAALSVVGEGLEEIPGNINEEGSQSGFGRSWFGDELKDADGDILRDESGTPLYSQDKDIAGRVLPGQSDGEDDSIRNFWDDAWDSFLGGAALGGAVTLPKLGVDIKHRGLNGRKNEVSDDVWDPTYDRWKQQYERTYGSIEE